MLIICICVHVFLHMSIKPEEVVEFSRTEGKAVVSHWIWVVEPKLQSSDRENCWVISPSLFSKYSSAVCHSFIICYPLLQRFKMLSFHIYHILVTFRLS